MPRILAMLVLMLFVPAAFAQFGASPAWSMSAADASAQNGSLPPASTTSQAPPQVTPQSTPIFPAPQPSAAPTGSASVPAAPAGGTQTAVSPGGPRTFDYSVNLKSDVFGAKMFSGNFLQSAASLFNPDYVVAIGDQMQVRLWGAYQFDSILTVDAQGNVFLPQVGPMHVAGVANRELQNVLDESLRRTFRANVFSYISLAAAQPVRVFVTGFVNRPGMYQGTSTDSVLRYLDQAGGIDADRGSFLDVKVLRGSMMRGTFNLYDFLLKGMLPTVQLGDGDVVVVAPRKRTFIIGGLAENINRFEFADSNIEMSRLIELARPFPSATHMRVTRNTGVVLNTEYYPLSEAGKIQLENGDAVDFTADKRPGTITVRVQGEHVSPQAYVLPYGSRLADVMKQIKLTERSDSQNIQLFRQSVQDRQSDMLQTSLRSIEQAVLTARSGTADESLLRKNEAELILNWTARARTVRPLGQVVVAQSQHREELLLENGDTINVPVKDGLVLIHGEVMFPNAIAFDEGFVVDDYIKRAGGYSHKTDTARIIVAHRDGSFSEATDRERVKAGDNILVLPMVDTKNRQFWKEISQVIFQLAVSARVVLGLK